MLQMKLDLLKISVSSETDGGKYYLKLVRTNYTIMSVWKGCRSIFGNRVKSPIKTLPHMF